MRGDVNWNAKNPTAVNLATVSRVSAAGSVLFMLPLHVHECECRRGAACELACGCLLVYGTFKCPLTVLHKYEIDFVLPKCHANQSNSCFSAETGIETKSGQIGSAREWEGEGKEKITKRGIVGYNWHSGPFTVIWDVRYKFVTW